MNTPKGISLYSRIEVSRTHPNAMFFESSEKKTLALVSYIHLNPYFIFLSPCIISPSTVRR